MEAMRADGQASQSEWPYSGFWRRVAATVIDNLILIVPIILVGAFTFGVGAIALIIAYGTYFESSEQRATWGKQACGIQVENLTGERLTVGSALFRQVLKFLGNILSIITWLIFFVPAAFTTKKQGLHDLAVSSVVRREPGKGIPSWLVGVIGGIVPGIAAIGVLAAITIPAYQDGVTRIKVTQARTQAAPLRAAVETAFGKTGKLPLDQSELSDVTVSPGATSVVFRDGRIEMSWDAGSQQNILYLTPVAENNRITWKCSSERIRPSQLPADCR